MKINSNLGLVSNYLSNGVTLHTIVPSLVDNYSSRIAYALARYSRSALSIENILKEVERKNIDSEKRLENIVVNYGHDSVRQLAGGLILCFENVPMYFAMEVFNVIPVIDGQERSTRFQDFSNPSYVDFGLENQSLFDTKANFFTIFYKDLEEKTYNYLKEKFQIDESNKNELSALKARTFDTVRYILPIGLNTSFGIVLNSQWVGKLINYLYARGNYYDDVIAKTFYHTIADGILELFTVESGEYLPQAGKLISHINKESSFWYKGLSIETQYYSSFVQMVGKDYSSVGRINNTENMLLQLKLGSINEFRYAPTIPLQSELFKLKEFTFNHKNTIGKLGEAGLFNFYCVSDLGAFRDINRHRTLGRFLPLLDNLDSPSYVATVCPYVQNSNLEDDYLNFYSAYKALPSFGNSFLDKMMLPLGTTVPFMLSGDYNSLGYCNSLRTRNGGHISYRLFFESLSNCYENPFNVEITRVNTFDKESFVDRS